MRMLVLSGAASVLFGCQSIPTDVVVEPAAEVVASDADATAATWSVAPAGPARAARPAPVAESAPAPLRPSSIWDPVVGEIVAAMQASYESQRRIICQNIANVDTPGYKRWTVEITGDAVADVDGAKFQVPRVVGAHRVFTVGCLDITDRSLDVAIDGDGYFSVVLPDGSTGYTRNGCFHIDADGRIRTGTGHLLVPAITIPVDTLEIAIEPTGTVRGRTAGAPDTDTCFGQLQIHRFVNPDGLRFEQGVFRPVEASGGPTTGSPGNLALGLLKQGFLERSNVRLEQELLNLQNLEQRHASIQRVLRHLGMIAP